MNGPLSARSGPSSDLLPIILATGAGIVAFAAGRAGETQFGLAAIGAIAVTVWLSLRHRAGQQTEAPPGVLDGWRAFHRELQRSRRANRPMTILRIAGDHGVEAAHRRANTLMRELRRIDHVWAQGSDVYALLPDTHRDAAGTAVARSIAHARVPAEQVHMASFPDDGLTSSSLMDMLRGGRRVAGAGLRPVADVSAPVLPALSTMSTPGVVQGIAAVAGPALAAVAAMGSGDRDQSGLSVRAGRMSFSDEESGSEVALA